MKTSIIKNKKLLALIVWMFIWQIFATLIGSELKMPSLLQTLSALATESLNYNFWISILASISRVLIGFTIASLLGVLIGILSGLSEWVYEFINPLVIAMKSIPVMSFILFAMIWFDSLLVPIVVCFIMCFPVVWTATKESINQVDKELVEMANVYKLSNKLRIKKIYIPAMIPMVVSSMTTALGLGWKSTIAAEVLSNPKSSIGNSLYLSKTYLETADLFAWTLVIVILSILMEKGFKYIVSKKLSNYTENR